jgi:hypothetical protein
VAEYSIADGTASHFILNGCDTMGTLHRFFIEHDVLTQRTDLEQRQHGKHSYPLVQMGIGGKMKKR